MRAQMFKIRVKSMQQTKEYSKLDPVPSFFSFLGCGLLKHGIVVETVTVVKKKV